MGAIIQDEINRRLTNSGAHPDDPRHRRQMMRLACPIIGGHADGVLRQVLRLGYHEPGVVILRVATPFPLDARFCKDTDYNQTVSPRASIPNRTRKEYF